MDGTFEIHGPALVAFAVTQAAMLAAVVANAWAQVAECRRRSRQRERELAVLEAHHALSFPRAAPPAGAGGDRGRGAGGTRP